MLPNWLHTFNFNCYIMVLGTFNSWVEPNFYKKKGGVSREQERFFNRIFISDYPITPFDYNHNFNIK